MNQRHDVEPVIDGIAITELLVATVALIKRRL